MRHTRLSTCSILPIAFCLLWLSAACSDDTSGGSSSGTPTTDSGATDATLFDTGPLDTGPLDTVAKSDVATAADGSADTGAPEQDVASPADVPVGPDCPNMDGCACTTSADCDSGLCIDTPAYKQCAHKCIDDCAEGFKCVPVDSGGGDTVTFCVPKWGAICNPCAVDADCASIGLKGSLCVDHGPPGNFCSVACGADGDCPSGHKCLEVSSVTGTKAKQCVPTPDPKSSAMYGACTCSPAARAAKLATSCHVKGGAEGKCLGQRACGAQGLGDCDAKTPAAEVCDGQDNDCNGKTDENSCDDGDACTEQDGCALGKCVGTAIGAAGCDDSDPCTVDTCDPAKGCQHAAEADGKVCGAGMVCTGGKCATATCKPECGACEACKEGKCAPSADGLPCDDDANPCTVDACKAGVCAHTAVADGTVCPSGACKAGKCEAVAPGCTAGAKRRCWVECPQTYAAGCLAGNAALIQGIETCAGGSWSGCATQMDCSKLSVACTNASKLETKYTCLDGTQKTGAMTCFKPLGKDCASSYYSGWGPGDCPDICTGAGDACQNDGEKRACEVHCGSPTGPIKAGTQHCGKLCSGDLVWQGCMTEQACNK